MAPKPRKESTLWLSCMASDLVVGDAIIFSTIVTKGRHGQAVRITKDGSTFEVPRRVEIIGRVVGFDRSKDNGKAAMVERTGVYFDKGKGEEEDLVLPPVVDLVLFSALDDEKADLGRHRTECPEERSYSGGMAYLRSRLHAAAGGDHRSRAAVQRVSECVLPSEIQRAKASDTFPDAVQMGLEAATRMLSGEDRYSESVVRQLRRQVVVERSVPWNDTPRPAAAPATAPRAEALSEVKSAPAPQPKPAIVVATGEVDPEVAAIMRQFPGVRIVDVRLRKDPHPDIPND